MVCIICGYDVVTTNSKTLNTEKKEFLKNWITFLINESGYQKQEVELLRNNALDSIYEYDRLIKINYNLKKQFKFTYA